MTLAVILFVGTFFPSAHAPLVEPRQSADQSATAAKPESTPPSQDNSQPAQSSSSPAQPPANATASPQAQTPSSKKPAVNKTHRRKKKQAAANCVPASSTAASGGSPANSASNPSTAGSSTPAATAPTVCPPPKTVVRQGGTSEPAIQLAGGAVGDQAAQQRHTASEMLSATEMNLKRLDETKLTASQQDMVKQVHQFMDQSKSATSAGDLERARTLAWKAQLLSEELVSPQK